MAEPKYKLKKGIVRTPEEHRMILQEIDTLHKKKSAVGVHKSKKRIYNTFGISSTKYKKTKKPQEQKERVHMREVYGSDFSNNIKHTEDLTYRKKKFI